MDRALSLLEGSQRVCVRSKICLFATFSVGWPRQGVCDGRGRVSMRESFRTWRIETARMRFHITAKLWHLQGWFDRWHQRVKSKHRTHQLKHIMAKLYAEREHLAFRRWWLNTRRRFEIVRVPGHRFPLTGEARVLSEGGRPTLVVLL